MAVGNRLIITSDDPEALALAADLVRLYTKTPRDPAEFTVIKLKSAVAADAGLQNVQEIGRVPSRFLGAIYSAVAERP